ncbi:MAG: AAA family ATPase [Anaerolineae bacterium]
MANHTARLIVLCGLPGSGKTTTARRLADSLPAIRLCPDEWMNVLGFNLWDEAFRERVEALQWGFAQELLRIGCAVIIEWGTWGRGERERLRRGARDLGAAVELRFLDLPVEELWRRLQSRDREVPPIQLHQLEAWAAAFQAPDDDELAQYDPPLDRFNQAPRAVDRLGAALRCRPPSTPAPRAGWRPARGPRP